MRHGMDGFIWGLVKLLIVLTLLGWIIDALTGLFSSDSGGGAPPAPAYAPPPAQVPTIAPRRPAPTP